MYEKLIFKDKKKNYNKNDADVARQRKIHDS